MYINRMAASAAGGDSHFWPRGKELWSFSSCSIQLHRLFTVPSVASIGLRFPWILHYTMLYGKLHVVCSVSHYFMKYRWRLWQRDTSHSVWFRLGIHRSLFPLLWSFWINSGYWQDWALSFFFTSFSFCKLHCVRLNGISLLYTS